MRIFAPALLLAACHRVPPAPVQSAPDASPSASAPAVLPNAVPTASSAPAPFVPPPPLPILAGEGPFAFVADAAGLVEVSKQGVWQVVTKGDVRHCDTDSRGHVVWFVQGDALYTFDLVDRTIHKILDASESSALTGDVIISWGNQQLGGLDKVEYDVALQINMTSPSKIVPSIGCDGDRSYYCYGDSYVADHPILHDWLETRKSAIEGARFLDPAYMAGVSARGRDGSLWTPLPKAPRTPRKKPKVDVSACDALPEQCGTLSAIPGTPYWKVTVANDRGDFFSQSGAVWDPASDEYIAVRDGKLLKSKKPESMDDLGGMRVSTTGVMSFQGAVFDGKTLYYAPSGGSGITCGWTNGGWRVPGVRDR